MSLLCAGGISPLVAYEPSERERSAANPPSMGDVENLAHNGKGVFRAGGALATRRR